jgi:hypothetical protein
MKGFEGVPGMAFHPILSEVKDVDGDGKLDIFRCRSEHLGARIERLRCDDGSVVWESEPVGAMFGDETRLPVFDLHGNAFLPFSMPAGTTIVESYVALAPIPARRSGAPRTVMARSRIMATARETSSLAIF